MISAGKIKLLFLIAISTLFCYRIALLNSREYVDVERAMSKQDLRNLAEQEIQTYIVTMVCDAIAAQQQTSSNSKAGAADQVATKLNNQLKHHGYMVKQMLEKNKFNEKELQKIEREIAIVEEAAKKLNILRLIDHALITEIKKSIQYLRMQAQPKENRLNI